MVHTHSFAELRELYRTQQTDPVAVTESALAHAHAFNDEYNAFALIDDEGARQAAGAAAARWRAGQPLSAIDGMVVGVKEFAAVTGWPTRRGSLLTPDTPATQDSMFVSRLRAAGAILLGKTRAPELNWKGVTDSPGFGITRNPLDAQLTPGGSSGGCAAAVAAGVVRVSIGSDAGGSVRIPAAFTGIFGLKPTQGRIPVVPYASHFAGLAHFGPLARDVHDLADVTQVVSGAHAGDWTSVNGNRQPLLTQPPVAGGAGSDMSRLDTLRVGILRDDDLGAMDPLVRSGLQLLTQKLSDRGIANKHVALPLGAAYEASCLLYRWGCVESIRLLGEQLQLKRSDVLAQIDPGLHKYLEFGDQLSLRDYTQAQTLRDGFTQAINALFEEIDVLLLPTVPILPFAAGRNVPEGCIHDDWLSWNRYTPMFNLVTNPALSVPVWNPGARLPVGVQLVGRPLEEETLLALADRLDLTL